MLSARIELRLAEWQDEKALRENWRLCFGDDDDYLDFFFRQRFEPSNTPVAVRDGKVVSQLFLLPAVLNAGENRYPVCYLFAAATHPQFRGQGLMGRLLRYSETVCRARGVRVIVLLPGEQSLYGYYARFGYETAFYRRRWIVDRRELAEIAAPAEGRDAQAFLAEYLSAREGLSWDDQALSFALSEHRRFRGGILASAHAFAAVSDDEAVCLCRAEDFPEAAALLLKLSDSVRFSVFLPPDLPLGTKENGGMIRCLNEPIPLRDAYIPFAME